MTFTENKSLQTYNTFGIDAKARYFSEFNSLEELKELIIYFAQKNIPIQILGGGSNILFTQDFDGVILKNNLIGISVKNENADFAIVEAMAGEVWHNFVLYCIDKKLGGIENLSLIPGSVGASPMQNIGAYGVEIKDVFESLTALDLSTLELKTFNSSDCCFGYRESVFKHKLKNKFVIISVSYKLSKKPKINTSYGAIEKELELQNISKPTIKDVSNAVCAIRSSKLPNPAEIGNAGSFFKNPTISETHFNELKTKFPNIIGYPNANKTVKVAAGWLIENAGFKGKRNGDAGVHKNQALVLVNYANAKGSEIVDLSNQIKSIIQTQYGIELETEVNIL